MTATHTMSIEELEEKFRKIDQQQDTTRTEWQTQQPESD